MSNSPDSSGKVALARLFWMMVGPGILSLLTIYIVSKGGGWFTPQDFGFLVVLAAIIFARWFEFQGESPKTAYGDPATPEYLRRFVIGALAIGLGVWVFANLLGNHWLTH